MLRENQGGWMVGVQLLLRTSSSQETGCWGVGWKMWGKKLNGGKPSLLGPDTKSHSCPPHLTQGGRKEVQAVLGCTPTATWEEVVTFGGGWEELFLNLEKP